MIFNTAFYFFQEILKDDSDNKKGLQAKYKMAKQKILEKKLSIDKKVKSEEEQK